MTFNRLIFSLGTIALALAAAASPARAQTCQTTADCHKGFVCVVNSTTPAPGPAPAGDATDVGTPTTGKLVAPQAGYCQAAECASDSECGPNMVCHTETIGTCPGGAAVAPCPANTDCSMTKVDVAPPTCTETKVSRCAFTWPLPCSADTDCGAGFICNPSVSGSCSGGGGTAPSSGSGTPGSAGASPSAGVPADLVAPVPPDNTCTETKSFPGWCQPRVTNCAADSECPTDWTCTAYPSRDAGTPVSSGAAGTSGTTSVDSDAKIAPGAPLPPSTTPVAHICTSPYSSGGYGVPKAVDGSASNTGGTGAAGTSGTAPPQQPGPRPTAQGPGSTESNGSASPNAGCALGGGAGSSVAFVGLALAAIVIARRKRG
jgi:hypothetical protein